MKQRVLVICLSIAMLLAVIPQTAISIAASELDTSNESDATLEHINNKVATNAEGVVYENTLVEEQIVYSSTIASGTCTGTKTTWKLTSDGTLTIGGSGRMDDDGYVTPPWNVYQYRDKITRVVIEEGVTSIGKNAFIYCSSIASVEIPTSVTSIGKSSFEGCSSLTSIEIPFGVTSIGSYAFRDCSSLTSIEIPSSVTSIGQCAFYYCGSLTSVTIPSSVTNIGSFVFRGCNSLSIYGFSDSYAQTYASENSIPFVALDVISSGTCGDNLTWKLMNDGTLNISGTGTMYDFEYGSYAPWYEYRDSVTTVVVEEGVTSLGVFAFAHCKGITNIILPSSVTNIGSDVFRGCDSLSNIVVNEANPNYSSVNGVLFDKAQKCLVVCPAGKSGRYSIPASIMKIEESAFRDCILLTDIEIPEGVVSIGSYAFQGCASLRTIVIPNGVISIGGYAFQNCISLKEIEIPASVTTIGSEALGYHSDGTLIGDFTLYGYTGTATETYATKNDILFVAIYVGNINSELISFDLKQADSGAYYLTGQIVVVEWVDGNSTVPKDTPIMTFKSTDSVEEISVFVTPTGTNTYYFDRFIEGLTLDKEYVFEIASGADANHSPYRSMNVSLATSTKIPSIKNLGKIGEQKISYYQADNGELRLYRKKSTYVGNINSELIKTELVKGPNGNYVSGQIVVVEWENGVSTVPFETPIMYFKSTDGLESLPVFVTPTGTNTYYFDRSLGDMDTSKEYVFTISSGDRLNVSPHKSMIVTTTAMTNKEGLLWQSDTQYVRYRTDANTGELRVYALDK